MQLPDKEYLQYCLSKRAFDRIIKVARTIADIDKQQEIKAEHMAEAIHYRSLDRDNWGK